MNQSTSQLFALFLVEALVLVVVAYFGFIAETIDTKTAVILIVGLSLVTTPLFLKIEMGWTKTTRTDRLALPPGVHTCR